MVAIERNDDKMSVREAGRKGGQATAASHGREFYEQIGSKGGKKVSQDREHMAQIGRKGGEARGRERRGVD